MFVKKQYFLISYDYKRKILYNSHNINGICKNIFYIQSI